MSDTVEVGSLPGLLAAAHALVDDLAGSAAGAGDGELVEALREHERLSRRLAAASYELINEAARRGLPGEHGAVTTGRWLRQLLRLHPSEANARAAAAEAAGPRVGISGEPLGPVFEHVAAGQAAGVVDQRQALLIERTIDRLPDEVAAEHGGWMETELVEHASRFDAADLAVLARRMVDHVHPDGTYLEPEQAERRRWLRVVQRADGTGHLEGELTAQLTERLLCWFDTAAAPAAATDGAPDDRRPDQRQHDALLTALDTAVRCGDQPANNGVSATVVVTMTSEQYLSGAGLATTGHGAVVPAADALGWGGGDTEILVVALNSMRAVTHYSNTHRIYSQRQRRVIAARDRGCTFPGCPEPPGRCQTNHVQRHEHHGRTSVTNGALVCRFHHRLLDHNTWQQTMINGVPWWTPPTWIDPHQTPRRNTLHDTAPAV